MIRSTSQSDAAERTQAIKTAALASAHPSRVRRDRLTTEGSDSLQAALQNQPEIRPDVVERGRALAADPSYPSSAIIRQISEQIVRSPDLSADPN